MFCHNLFVGNNTNIFIYKAEDTCIETMYVHKFGTYCMGCLECKHKSVFSYAGLISWFWDYLFHWWNKKNMYIMYQNKLMYVTFLHVLFFIHFSFIVWVIFHIIVNYCTVSLLLQLHMWEINTFMFLTCSMSWIVCNFSCRLLTAQLLLHMCVLILLRNAIYYCI